MKAMRAIRLPSTFFSNTHDPKFKANFFSHFFSAQPQIDHFAAATSSFGTDTDIDSSAFDSAQFSVPYQNLGNQKQNPQQNRQPTWDTKYRDEVNRRIFGKANANTKRRLKIEEEEKEEKKRTLARALLQAALDGPDEEEEEGEDVGVKGEDQKSLSVGIIGAPNAGKSALTNYMVSLLKSAFAPSFPFDLSAFFFSLSDCSFV